MALLSSSACPAPAVSMVDRRGGLLLLGVATGRPLLRRKLSGVHSVSTYVRQIIRRDFLDDRTLRGESKADNSGHVIHDVIGSMPSVVDSPGDTSEYPGLSDLPSEPFMLFIGALRRVKGVAELIAAYGLLKDPPLLVLIGTAEPDSPAEFPPGVRVLLDVPHESVMAAANFEHCLFGVMPSLLPEPFGTVVLEVMSHAKPVIGTSPGGHADMIIDGETGLLVPSGDVEALARAMQTLISDPVSRNRMGEAAQECAGRFTAEQSIPRLERLYEQLVARSDAAS